MVVDSTDRARVPLAKVSPTAPVARIVLGLLFGGMGDCWEGLLTQPLRFACTRIQDELSKVASSDDLKGAVLLVFANKQDLKDSMTAAELSSSLNLHSIKNHDWHIQACSAKKGEGLKEGFDWIVDKIRK